MSKLVKLTSNENRNKSDNSFKCQCDDDIILPPNSKVSLINAHISSGILSSYAVGSDFNIGNDNGEKLGELYLTADNSDRKREIMLDAGNYQISQVLNDMTKQFNKSLMFTSQSGVVSGTNTFNIPSEPDFGMAVVCSLDQDKKVNITYNLGGQAYTSDLSYKNTNAGVTVDPSTGAISYTAGAGLKTLTLNKASADTANRVVYSTITDPAQDFPNYTPVTLQDTTGRNRSLTAQIESVTQGNVNTNYAIQLDKTKGDATAQTVQSNPFDSRDTTFDGVFNIGDTVTLDDGLGVLGTPSGAQITGDIGDVDKLPVNPYYIMNELMPLQTELESTIPDINVSSTQDLGSNKAIITVDLEIADVATFHIVEDAIFHLINTKQDVCAFFTIETITQNKADADKTDIQGIISPVNGSFVLDDVILMNTYQLISTSAGTVDQFADLELTELDTLLFLRYNKDEDKYYEMFTVKINFITYEGTDKNIFFEMLPNTFLFDTGSGFAKNDLEFYKLMANLYGDDENDVFITSFSRLITDKITALTDFDMADGDFAVFQTGSNLIEGLQVSGTPDQFIDADGENRVICPIKSIKYGDAYQDYVNMKNLILGCLVNKGILYKNDNSVVYKFTLTNFVRPTVDPANIPLAKRMWKGTQIEQTNAYNLVYPANNNTSLKLFDLMVLGNNQVSPNISMALEDKRLSHSCGRACFLVSQVGLCKMGIIEEDTFINMNVGNAFYSVNIVGAPNNYVYEITKGGTAKVFKTDIEALAGDRVCIQWGVSPSSSDYEYNNSVGSATNPNQINNNSVFKSSGVIDERDRGKILVSILRAGQVNTYLYLGSVTSDVNTVNGRQARAIPWTPRENPYIQPDYYDGLKNFHMFVAPNTAQITPLEITPDPTVTTVDGVTKQIDPVTSVIHNDDSLHSVSNPDIIDQSHNLNAYSGNFNFTFTDLYLQKQLGYNIPTLPLAGKKGTWVADKDYLKAYLPENLVVLLDNMSNIQTFDCNKTNGTRRNIIAVCNNTQVASGEINIEPNNLYKISLQNQEPINLRKFNVSFENFYGEPIQLQSARAVVNLLFEQ